MDELERFCARVLGDHDAAVGAVQSARRAGGEDRLERLAHAVAACRRAPETSSVVAAAPAPARAANGDGPDGAGPSLAEAVAAELAAATGRLPARQREALALRELLGLNHREVAAAIGIEVAAVAPLLARSRIGLRAELRDSPVEAGECLERERMLRAATLRQDGEGLGAADEDWLIEHLGHCPGCARAHAAMLEGATCYRGWPAA
jgi:DNA-directed RNA polymerase specialized sigma24 family protein